MRIFETGATRSDDEEKVDFEGILSPLVLLRFGEYMLEHSIQEDGKRRASDNWQKGIPREEYLKSALRHVISWWGHHRNPEGPQFSRDIEDTLCAVMFNVMGYLHESLKESPIKSEMGFYPGVFEDKLREAGCRGPREPGWVRLNER
jgi:hypothetical protein